jgi:hypothetical protein
VFIESELILEKNKKYNSIAIASIVSASKNSFFIFSLFFIGGVVCSAFFSELFFHPYFFLGLLS